MINYEGRLCTVCEKGQLFKHKADIQFDRITIMKQSLYICDMCNTAFQNKEDYRHTEYLRSMAYLRKYNKKEQ